jgi:hypothetical protein
VVEKAGKQRETDGDFGEVGCPLCRSNGPLGQADRQSCHIGIVRPCLSPVPSFLATLMSAPRPMRKMNATRKPRMTGRVKKSDNALSDMVGDVR